MGSFADGKQYSILIEQEYSEILLGFLELSVLTSHESLLWCVIVKYERMSLKFALLKYIWNEIHSVFWNHW